MENEQRCNICEFTLATTDKSMELLEHIKEQHKEVYELHRLNPEATVGFRIEFLHLNVLKDDGDPKSQPVILEEVSTEEIVEPVDEKQQETELEQQIVLVPKPKKIKQMSERSGKYFAFIFVLQEQPQSVKKLDGPSTM